MLSNIMYIVGYLICLVSLGAYFIIGSYAILGTPLILGFGLIIVSLGQILDKLDKIDNKR